MDRERLERNRERVVNAIIAFDTILQDILGDLDKGEEPNTIACMLMELLSAQILSAPIPTQSQADFLLNMADLGSRIRRFMLCVEPDEEKLQTAIAKTKYRLRELGPRSFYEMQPLDTSVMN